VAPAPHPTNGTLLLATNATTALSSRGSEILGDILLTKQEHRLDSLKMSQVGYKGRDVGYSKFFFSIADIRVAVQLRAGPW